MFLYRTHLYKIRVCLARSWCVLKGSGSLVSIMILLSPAGLHKLFCNKPWLTTFAIKVAVTVGTLSSIELKCFVCSFVWKPTISFTIGSALKIHSNPFSRDLSVPLTCFILSYCRLLHLWDLCKREDLDNQTCRLSIHFGWKHRIKNITLHSVRSFMYSFLSLLISLSFHMLV